MLISVLINPEVARTRTGLDKILDLMILCEPGSYALPTPFFKTNSQFGSELCSKTSTEQFRTVLSLDGVHREKKRNSYFARNSFFLSLPFPNKGRGK